MTTNETPAVEETPADSSRQETPQMPSPAAYQAGTPAEAVHSPKDQIPEAPFMRVRVGLLLWAAIVMITGLMMIASSFINGISFGVLFTMFIAGFGLLLIVGAGISAVRSRH